MNARARKRRGFLFAIGVLVPMILWPDAAVSLQDGQKHGDWVIKCRDTENGRTSKCVLAQAVKRKDGEEFQMVMSTLLGRFGPDDAPGMVISVPLGVYLPAGAIVDVGGGKAVERLDFEFCNRTGCRAVLRMNQRWLDLLGSETRAGVTIRNRRQREIKIPLSLKGISDGIAAIGIR